MGSGEGAERHRHSLPFGKKPASFMVALVPIVLGDFHGLLCGCFFASDGARMGEWLLFGFDVVVYTSTVI
jgi:hypothetical protein